MKKNILFIYFIIFFYLCFSKQNLAFAEEIWRFETNNYSPSVAHIAVSKAGVLYLGINNVIFAVNKQTGEIIKSITNEYEHNVQNAYFWSKIDDLVISNQGNILVAYKDGKIKCFSENLDIIVWEIDLGNPGNLQNLMIDNLGVLHISRNPTICVNVNSGEVIRRNTASMKAFSGRGDYAFYLHWGFKYHLFQAINIKTGDIVWTKENFIGKYFFNGDNTSGLLFDGNIYKKSGQSLLNYNFRNGKLVWEKKYQDTLINDDSNHLHSNAFNYWGWLGVSFVNGILGKDNIFYNPKYDKKSNQLLIKGLPPIEITPSRNIADKSRGDAVLDYKMDHQGNLFCVLQIGYANGMYANSLNGKILVIAINTPSKGYANVGWPTKKGNLRNTKNFLDRDGPPSFATILPDGHNLIHGYPLNLKASHAGDGPFIYKWLKNGEFIYSSEDLNYSVDASLPNDAGNYKVIIKNKYGEIETPDLTITIREPVVKLDVTSKDLIYGTNTEFNITHELLNPYKITWLKDGRPINYVNGTNYVLENAQSADAGTYKVLVSNKFGEVESNSIDLSVRSYKVGEVIFKYGSRTGSYNFTAGSNDLIYVPLRNKIIAIDQNNNINSFANKKAVTNLTINNDGVVFFGDNSSFYAVDPDSTIRSIWKLTNPKTACAVDDSGNIYLGSGRKVYSLNYETGLINWNSLIGNVKSSCTPSLGSNNRLFTGNNDGDVFALNTITGEKIWELKLNSQSITSIAINSDNKIFIGGGNIMYCIDSITGSIIWEFKADGLLKTSPVLGLNKLLYFGSAYVYALNSESGKLVWRHNSGSSFISSPTIGNNGTVYISSQDRFIHALDGITGNLNWKYRARYRSNLSPLIRSGGFLYFVAGDLYCIKINDIGLADTSWPMLGANTKRTSNIKVNTKEITSYINLESYSYNSDVLKYGEYGELQLSFDSFIPSSINWLKDGEIISNENKLFFVIKEAKPSDAGKYSALINAGFNSYLTPEYDLKIHKPTITINVTKYNYKYGETIILDCITDSVRPYTIQWKKNGEVVDGAVGTKLVKPAIKKYTGKYRAELTNNYGTFTSNLVDLYVRGVGTPPEIKIIQSHPNIITIDYSNLSGKTYILQSSTDLLNWQSLDNEISQTDQVGLNVQPAEEKMFYRLKLKN